jgi:hypothetical protein
MQENLLKLLEHFASPTPPVNPTIGQIWFNSQNNTLFVYFGGTWNHTGVTPSATAPTSPAEGTIWYDTVNDALKVWNGVAWDSFVTLAGTQTLTNKTLTAPTLTTPTVSAGGIVISSTATPTPISNGHVYFDGTTLNLRTGGAWRGLVTTDYLTSQGYVTTSNLSSQGFLTAENLSGYATQSWVTSQGYATETWATSQFAPIGSGSSGTTVSATHVYTSGSVDLTLSSSVTVQTLAVTATAGQNLLIILTITLADNAKPDMVSGDTTIPGDPGGYSLSLLRDGVELKSWDVAGFIAPFGGPWNVIDVPGAGTFTYTLVASGMGDGRSEGVSERGITALRI